MPTTAELVGAQDEIPASSSSTRAQMPRMMPIQPIPRNRVGLARLRTRDDWNLQELRIQDLFTRHDLDKSADLDEWEFQRFFQEFIGREPNDGEIRWVTSVADRDRDGRISLDELYFGLQCWHGYQSLQKDALRLFAETGMEARSLLDEDQLIGLMTQLNAQLPVERKEVELVLQEAERLASSVGGSGAITRLDLLRAVGTWYVYIVRRNTHWKAILGSSLRNWLPEREHHTEVLARLATSGPALSRGLLAIRRSKGGAGLLSSKEDLHHEVPAARGFAVILQLATAVLVHLIFLVTLLFPTIFFASLIYIGSAHGTDRCPKDLGGILVWYGALGATTMVVNCSDAGRSKVSCVASMLRFFMAVLPWVGLAWILHLNRASRHECGQFQSWTSTWLWSMLVFLELYFIMLVLYTFARTLSLEKRLRPSTA